MPARYRMTPARKAALKRAQEISARKRRKWKMKISKKRRKKPEVQKNRRRAAVAIGVGVVGAIAAHNVIKVQLKKLDDERWEKEFDAIDRQAAAERSAAREAEIKRLTKIAGNLHGRPESQEELDARIKLYGPVMGETSDVHKGRAEIFPGVPQVLVNQEYANATSFPSIKIDTSQDVVMYHRTGGGNDVDPEQAAQSIIDSQSLVVLNRDERRMADALTALNAPTAGTFDEYAKTAKLAWMSNKLNDSNSRNAFGETVIKITIPAAVAQQMGQQSFGKLSSVGEVWGFIDPALLVGAKFERVAPEEITPKVEPTFRIP